MKIHKFFFICLFLGFCFFQSFAQTLKPQWVARNGGTGTATVTVTKSVIDAFGNSYNVGYFRGTVDFNPGAGTFNLTSASLLDNDLFVQKLNSDGSFAWARRIGASFSNTAANAVSLGPSGVIWVTGRFNGTVDFDPGPGTANLTSVGGVNTFVLKLDNNGNYLWAGRFASSVGGNEGLGIVSSSSGDVFVTGYFSGANNFDPTSSSTSPIGGSILGVAGGRDIFVAKLNSSGTYQAAVREGEFNDDAGRDIKIDASGDILVTGNFQGNTVSFGAAAGLEDVFIWKLNPSSLATIWGRRVGGTSSEMGLALATSSGDVFITGYFNGTADFDPGVGVVNLTSAGLEDIFVLKLNSMGVYEWARRMGGTANERGLGVATTIGGSVYTTGYFNGTADFDPGVGVVNLTSAGGEDIFVSLLSSSGNFVYAKQIEGAGNQRAVSIHLLPTANMSVYLSGYFEGSTDFDPELTTFSLTPTGTRDSFMARYVECPGSVPFTPSGGVLPGASYGVSYSQTFSTSLGGPLTWTLIAGPLPPGFTGTQVGSNYVVSGTTTSFGLFNFTLQVSNGDCSYTQSYQIFCSQMIFNEITGSPFTSTTNFTEDMTLGDFNKDGVLDLIYPVGFVSNCQIKLGDEIGTFSSAPISVSTSAYAESIASFDVDNDGFVDAVTVNNGATLDYLRGTATSPYLSAHQTGVSLGTPILTQGANEIVLADIDNDGDMDAITVGSYFSTNHYISLRVLPFDHINNQFLPPIVADTLILTPSPPSKLYLDVGDIDNDGFVDVAVASNHPNYHPIWFRNINGTAFNQYYSVVPATTYANLKDIKVADFNNDGRKDIAILASNGFDDVFRMYINNGGPLSSRFNAPTGINTVASVLNEFRQMAVADFDGDRDLDIAISAMNGTDGRFAIIRNQPTGSFYLDTYQNSVSSNPYAITAGDFNRDGLIDVAVQDRTTNNNLRIFLNATVPAVAPRIGHYALRFSYSNDRGETNEAVITKNSNFTVEGWIKLRQSSNNQYIFYNGNFGTNGFGLYVPSLTRELHIISYQAGVPTDINVGINTSGDDFLDDYWNHFAFGRKSNGEWFFFWNGENDSFTTPPTHSFSSALNSDKTYFGWRGVFPTTRGASFDEFRFWNTALTQDEVQEWMNLKANKDHPQSVNIAAHYDFNVSPTPTATIAFDESEKIYPPSQKKNANFVLAYPNTLDSNWTKRIPPVANFGSSKSIFVNAGNQASVLDYDPQTGIRVQFNSAVFPTGRLVVTRALEYPTDFPNPNGIPKVYWTIRNYGTPKTFDPLEMLRVRLTQMQCDSAKPAAIPLPDITNYTTYYLAKRPSNSNNPADWQIIGPPQAYGTLQYRRPGSVISDFSQLNIIHSLTPLDLRLLEFSGKRYDVNTNILQWKAYFSTNEKGLVLEKSFDALNFFPIHQQPVMFDNRKAVSYTFKDLDALGAAYYRLKLTDETGKNHYSKIIFIDKMFVEQFSIYPNPTTQGQEVKIKISDTHSQEMAQLSICNLQGKTLWQKSGSIEELEKSLNKDLNTFLQGLYIMKIQVKQKLYTAKWIKE